MIRPALAAPRLAALALALPAALAAQEAPDGNRFVFKLGAGFEARPTYFGADDVTVGPDLIFDFGALDLGPLDVGNPDLDAVRTGWGLRGAFRYIRARSSDDNPELEGLEDIDPTIEIGLGASYAQPNWEAFALGRYGVIGHQTLSADLGLDGILRPTSRWTLRAGPRIYLGTDNYAATYYGVSPAESAASGGDLPAYEASGGVLGAGVVVSAEYRLTPVWGVGGGLRYERLLGDAEGSPVTFEDDQLSVFAGVTRRFDLRF